MTMNIFERAARAKLRFETDKGSIATEQLYDLPLSQGANNLNDLARKYHEIVHGAASVSFVEERPDPAMTMNTLRLDLIKHVITSKLADKRAAETRAEKAERRGKLLEALAAKEVDEMKGMSKEQILAELEG